MKLSDKEVNVYIAFIIIILIASFITFGFIYSINVYGGSYVEEK